ncbi:MAG: hypothetical protein ACOVP8_04510, partial [Phycisphaerales bacterium]
DPNTPAEQWLARGAALAPEELECIEHAVRQHLNLPDGTPLCLEHFAAIREMWLSGKPITDASLAWLAAADSPLSALSHLYLNETHVTDLGLAALASDDSPLTSLTELYLDETQITDAGLAALAAQSSPFAALMHVSVSDTQVTNAGFVALKNRFPAVTFYN